MVSIRQEVSHIRAEHDRAQRRTGEEVVWFEMIPFGDDEATESSYGDLYNWPEPGVGGRRFAPGNVIPVLWLTENEDAYTPRPEGRQPVETITMAIAYRSLVDRGITEPFESTHHLSDVIFYDGRYYRVNHYRVRGRLQDDLNVLVSANEVFLDQEFVNDPGPELPAVTNYQWPAEFPGS